MLAESGKKMWIGLGGLAFAKGKGHSPWIGLVGLLLCAGCATKPPMPDPEQLSSLPEATGVVVGSMTRAVSMKDYHSFLVRFMSRRTAKGVFQDKPIYMKHPEGDTTFDISQRDRQGDLFALVLSAGDYELYGATAFSDVSWYESGSDLRIRFSVPPGGILYLGEIHFTPGMFHLSDNWNRDSRLFKARYSNVDWSQVHLHSEVVAGNDGWGNSGSALPQSRGPSKPKLDPLLDQDINRVLNEALEETPKKP